ncbi:MAG: D-serine ammonia-lyase [Pontibacterium sp.]
MTTLNIQAFEQAKIRNGTPFLWLNDRYGHTEAAPTTPDVKVLYEAEARLKRFAPLLETLFPELADNHGLIESPLLAADKLNSAINPLGGKLLLKADHALPVAGSIKARGGIHEVLCMTEALALEQGLIHSIDDDYQHLISHQARQLFSRYKVAVGSTGNLGLSIGIISAALGFDAVVHMSSDAKAWKKTRLRACGVTVIEHDTDYSAAVAAGRTASDADPYSYFVDDENSSHLFMGYAVAAIRLKKQLEAMQLTVDATHPLFVYLPAGVGGAPGGITFGLKMLFGDNVHCFLAEPVQAPCMLLGMAGAPNSDPVPVYDFGLKIITDADGLAVGKASQWVCDATRHLVSGVFTATDRQLYQKLQQLKAFENIEVEPSAAIGCLGPIMMNSPPGQRYIDAHHLAKSLKNSIHIAWLTGGALMPQKEYQHYLEKSIKLFA